MTEQKKYDIDKMKKILETTKNLEKHLAEATFPEDIIKEKGLAIEHVEAKRIEYLKKTRELIEYIEEQIYKNEK